MHRHYGDILKRIPETPKWWIDGVPRYEKFTPHGLSSYEVALVHTQCQNCGVRYDIAVIPRPPLFHSLTTELAYTNSLDIGDPPFACAEVRGGIQCAGYTMSVSELEILEFWSRGSDIRSEWIREETMEKPLDDARWDSRWPEDIEKPIWESIYQSDDRLSWKEAISSGDQRALIGMLERHGCTQPEQVATMVDLDERYRHYREHLSALRIELRQQS